jgi:hypothetical protein
MKYKAFLSYAWPDRGVAVPLHRKLERIGKRRWWDARARRVFLDRESAVASDDLWAKVENALRESSFLVVLASPRAAASPWVQREVEWWRRHRGSLDAFNRSGGRQHSLGRQGKRLYPGDGRQADRCAPWGASRCFCD